MSDIIPDDWWVWMLPQIGCGCVVAASVAAAIFFAGYCYGVGR